MSKKEVLPPFSGLEVLEKRLEELKMAMKVIKEQHNTSLEGKLYITKSHGTIQYRIVGGISSAKCKNLTGNNKEYSYISKRQKETIHKYAQKEYDEKIIKILKKQVEKIEILMSEIRKNPSEMALEELHQEKRRSVNPATLMPEKYTEAWLKVSYRGKRFYPNDLLFFTTKGERVRSKSEIIIADTLNYLGIPYRYEFPVKLGKYIVHPDFYCLNLRNRSEFLWEHFGMMDNLEYSCSAVKKIKMYQKNGFFPGKNLIISLETSDSPINPKQVEEIVRRYLI